MVVGDTRRAIKSTDVSCFALYHQYLAFERQTILAEQKKKQLKNIL